MAAGAGRAVAVLACLLFARLSQPGRQPALNAGGVHRAGLALYFLSIHKQHQRGNAADMALAQRGFGLVLILAKRTCGSAAAAWAKAGAIIWQGPHHGAQKSTNTGISLRRRWRSALSTVSSRGWPLSSG